jgi:hypothetical protein
VEQITKEQLARVLRGASTVAQMKAALQQHFPQQYAAMMDRLREEVMAKMREELKAQSTLQELDRARMEGVTQERACAKALAALDTSPQFSKTVWHAILHSDETAVQVANRLLTGCTTGQALN